MTQGILDHRCRREKRLQRLDEILGMMHSGAELKTGSTCHLIDVSEVLRVERERKPGIQEMDVKLMPDL